MTQFDSLTVEGVDMSERAIFHVMGRARHYGFLAVAAYPDTYPKGFVAYFQTTMDSSGQNWSRMFRVLAYADEMAGELHYQSGLHDNGYDTQTFFSNTRQNLEVFAKLAGPATFDEFARYMEVPPAEPHLLSFVGVLRSKGALLGELTFVQRVYLLPVAFLLLQATKQDSILLPLKGERNAVLYNLEQHCKYLLPSYFG